MSITSKSQIGHVSLPRAIDIWADHVTWLETSDEAIEVANSLVWRDIIEEALREGEVPNAADEKKLADADRLIREKADALYRNHSEVFDENRNRVPDDRWWWKLGPAEQVRLG